jgi:hypothetical protein
MDELGLLIVVCGDNEALEMVFLGGFDDIQNATYGAYFAV